MMSAADEEPQITASTTANNLKMASINPQSNASSLLISESFNLVKPLTTTTTTTTTTSTLSPSPSLLTANTAKTASPSPSSSSSSLSFTSILPPLNHFQPISSSNSHSRTPSTDLNLNNQTAATATATTLASSGLFKQQQSFNSSALAMNAVNFFDKVAAGPSPSSSSSADNLKQLGSGDSNSLRNTPSPLIAAAKQSTLPPPLMVPPPSINLGNIAAPPPPPPPPSTQSTHHQSSSTSGNANPFSARGALNKKVYDQTAMPTLSNLNLNPLMMTPPSLAAAFQSPPPPPPSSASSMIDSTSASNIFVPQPPPSNTQQTPTSIITGSSLQSMTAISSSSAFPSPPQPIFPNSPPTIGTAATNSQSIPTSASFNSSLTIGGGYQTTPTAAANYQLSSSQMSQSQSQNSFSSQNAAAAQNKNVWNWLTQNKYVNSFVEKAKHGVESIVTTIDPQMKEYIYPANRPIYLLSSSANLKLVKKIQEAFNDTGFSKLTLSYYDAAPSTQFAPQIVGFACAQQAAREKLDNTLQYVQQQSMQQQQLDCVVIAFQDFLAELTPDSWFELSIVMLKDKQNDIELTLYTEAYPVSNDDLNQLKSYTPHDYALKWSGFSCRLPEKNFNFNSSAQSTVLSYDTFDTTLSMNRMFAALKSAANLFKSKLINQVQQQQQMAGTTTATSFNNQYQSMTSPLPPPPPSSAGGYYSPNSQSN